MTSIEELRQRKRLAAVPFSDGRLEGDFARLCAALLADVKRRGVPIETTSTEETDELLP